MAHVWLRRGRAAGSVVLLVCAVFGVLAEVELLGGQFSAKLTEVRVAGSKRFQEAQIVSATGLKLGSSVSPADFTAAARKLAEVGVFSSVRFHYKPAGDGVAVEFEVVDADKFFSCQFGNFVWFTRDELLAAIRSRVSLFAGEAAAGGSQIRDIGSALEAFLKERGIAGNVTFDLEGNPAGSGGRVVYTVDGVAIMVHEVELPGVTQVDRDTLGRLTGAMIGQPYDPALMGPYLRDNLRLEYGDLGYLKASFGAPTTEVMKHDGPETWVKVTLPVKEGSQYHLAAIHWPGDLLFPEEQLTQKFGMKPGDVANQGLLLKGMAMAESLYGTRGYARARIEPVPTFDDAAHTVNYELRVNEGSIYRMGKLTIMGLDGPTTARVEGACLLELGQVYDRSYWGAYLHSIAGTLPPEYRHDLPPLKEEIDDAAKTVNVRFNFAAKSAP